MTSEVCTIGLDLAKNVFQVHGADASGNAVFRKQLRRGQVLKFFADLPRCLVAMEACGSSHFWAREIGQLGHEVRMIPPAYVKPFIKVTGASTPPSGARYSCKADQRRRDWPAGMKW
jgi:transposase